MYCSSRAIRHSDGNGDEHAGPVDYDYQDHHYVVGLAGLCFRRLANLGNRTV